jgi:hypothetical protein
VLQVVRHHGLRAVGVAGLDRIEDLGVFLGRAVGRPGERRAARVQGQRRVEAHRHNDSGHVRGKIVLIP